MGFFQVLGNLLAGKTVSVSTSSSTSTGTTSDSSLPSAVRNTATSSSSLSRTVDGVTTQQRANYARYTIDAADAAKWTGKLGPPIEVDALPHKPGGASWWIDEASRAGLTFYDARPITGTDGFVAISADGQTVYVYSTST